MIKALRILAKMELLSAENEVEPLDFDRWGNSFIPLGISYYIYYNN